MRRRMIWRTAVALACTGLAGCGGSCATSDEANRALTARVVPSYADLMHSMYSDSAVGASALLDAVHTFIAEPTQVHLDDCRQAWLDARPFYIQTEVARFSEGPIDRVPDGPEAYINAWPLDEAYIDYVVGNPGAGWIQDPAQPITPAALRAANERGGETNVTTGWHAIEFLLWGQDTSAGPGGGNRAHTDFVDGEAEHAARRRSYLKTCTEMLVSDLSAVRDEWAPERAGNYRSRFLDLDADAALARIVTGVGRLAFGELRGERLTAPYVTKDREDEHSCFSDTTHLDHLNDAIGIRNVWLGRYASSDGRNDHDGTGLRALARARDRALADQVDRQLAEVIEALDNPALAPFDQAILGDDDQPGRRAVRAAIERLASLNRSFSKLAGRLGVAVGRGRPP